MLLLLLPCKLLGFRPFLFSLTLLVLPLTFFTKCICRHGICCCERLMSER
jgi:hypothetical protein